MLQHCKNSAHSYSCDRQAGHLGVIQEDISNDRSSSTIVLEEVPDVYVDAIAIPDPTR